MTRCSAHLVVDSYGRRAHTPDHRFEATRLGRGPLRPCETKAQDPGPFFLALNPSQPLDQWRSRTCSIWDSPSHPPRLRSPFTGRVRIWNGAKTAGATANGWSTSAGSPTSITTGVLRAARSGPPQKPLTDCARSQAFNQRRPTPIRKPPTLSTDVRRHGQCGDLLAFNHGQVFRSGFDLHEAHVGRTGRDDVEQPERNAGPCADVAAASKIFIARRSALNPLAFVFMATRRPHRSST